MRPEKEPECVVKGYGIYDGFGNDWRFGFLSHERSEFSWSIGIYKNPVKRKMSKKMYKWKIRWLSDKLNEW